MEITKNTDKLCLKNIHDLLGMSFYVPAYQRGYRWGAGQVKALLDDIWDFTLNKSTTFYCLQPIVVTRGNNSWLVVDGQQRLTTIFLILKFLEHDHLRRPLEEAYQVSLYQLDYETRPECTDYLLSLSEEQSSENIDYFYLFGAYQAIKEWFSDKNYNENNKFLDTLLAKSNTENAVKVIWYDLSDECADNDYAIDVFSRLNIGKIPLTNSELVRALFLQKSNFKHHDTRLKQIQIAHEWDVIEQRLQEPAFWHFITNTSKKYATRIEYIFDLMKGKKETYEAFYTFYEFQHAFKYSDGNIEQLWLEIKNYFLTFEEWYQDRELYHLIGFLVDCGENINSLKLESKKCISKSKFREFLKDKIKIQFNSNSSAKLSLAELEYGDLRIKKLLLLFNIKTLLSTQEAEIRFPFDRYKLEKWDIEHIDSQSDFIPSGEARKEWLSDILAFFNKPIYLKNENTQEYDFFIQADKLFNQQKLDNSLFETFYSNINDYFHNDMDVKSNKEDGKNDWLHSIGNLALLDATTNRSYKNAPFMIKREQIIRNDKCGVFIPICTKNVFLKYYSQTTPNLFCWSQSDSKEYQEAIAQILKEYL